MLIKLLKPIQKAFLGLVHDDDIDIAIKVGFFTGDGPKQNNFFGMNRSKRFDNPGIQIAAGIDETGFFLNHDSIPTQIRAMVSNPKEACNDIAQRCTELELDCGFRDSRTSGGSTGSSERVEKAACSQGHLVQVHIQQDKMAADRNRAGVCDG
jgi:hypothetical protein